MVKEARREYFSKHSSNFVTDGNCNLSGMFKHLAIIAGLLGISIYETQSPWTGPEELKQANYILLSLPKGLKFIRAVPPLESPKVMGLIGNHDPDALCHFGSVTYCPWCRKEGQNKGTVVNHLQTTHYRLGLVCDRCYSCLSTTSVTSAAMAGMTVADLERAFPPSQVHLLNLQEYTAASAKTPHKEVKTEWSTQAPLERRPAEKALLTNPPSLSLILPFSSTKQAPASTT